MSLFDELMGIHGDNTVLKRSEIIRAPFTVVGAKSRSLQHILPKLPITPMCTWVDHFGGSGIVSWNVPKCKLMVYNDAYSAYSTFYKVMREQRDELTAYIESIHPHSREEWGHCRDTWVHETDPVIRSGKWLYMTVNSVLHKRKAFARSLTQKLWDTKNATSYLQSLWPLVRDFVFENLDARQSFKDFDSADTIHYLDPPYVETDQKAYSNQWTWDDMRELLSLISHAQGFVALSHYPDKRIDDAVDWSEEHVWKVEVSSDRTDGRKQATEKLWIKNANC